MLIFSLWDRLGRGWRVLSVGITASLLTLLELVAGHLAAHAQTGTTTDAAKEKAIQLIEDNYQGIIARIESRYADLQGQRLVWLALLLLIVMPLVGFLGFLLFPYFSTKTVKSRVRPDQMGQVRKLYFTQALVAATVLLALGFNLCLIQLWLGALGTITNPQIVLQEQAITYIHDNSRELVEAYADIFVGVAQNLGNDPDEAILTTIINNAAAIRSDNLLNFSIGLVNFVWPLVGNTYIIILGLVLLFFLRRTWPDLRRMLNFPVEFVTGQVQTGRPPAYPGPGYPQPQTFGPLPPAYPPPPYYNPAQPPAAYYPPQNVGQIPPPGYPPQNYNQPPGYYPPQPAYNMPPAGYAPSGYYQNQPQPALVSPTKQMWKFGRRLIWNEAQVMLAFAVLIFLLAIIMAIFLLLFFGQIAGLLVQVTSIEMVYFITQDGASFLIVLATFLMLVFLVECIGLFLAAFALLVGKVLDSLRNWFAGKTNWKKSGGYLGKHLLRFLWVVLLATVLGIGLTIGAAKLAGYFIGGDNPNWFLGLISTPLVLLIGLNLGMWLFRGFRCLRRMASDTMALDAVIAAGSMLGGPR